MPVSWVNQIKHPEPLYLYSTYSMVHIATWSIHVFYFSTVYTIPVSRRFVPVGYTVQCTVYTVNRIHKCSINKTFSVLMSPEVTTNVPDLCSNNTR